MRAAGAGKNTDTAPPTPTEYARLARWLLDAKKRRADLLGADARCENDDPPLPAARLLALLDRGGALALAIESWSNRGLWVVSRSDNEIYPRRLKPFIATGALWRGKRHAPFTSGWRLLDPETQMTMRDFTTKGIPTCAEQGSKWYQEAPAGWK